MITHEQITKRAYELYLKRGAQPGNAETDWLQAEAELKREMEFATAITLQPATAMPSNRGKGLRRQASQKSRL